MRESVRCRVPPGVAAFWLGAIGLMTFVGVPALLIGIIRTQQPPLWFAALWLGIIAAFWFQLLFWYSYEVRLWPTGRMEFKSVFRTVERDARQLARVEARSAFDPYTVVFTFLTGKSRVVRVMDGFFELIQELKRLNPDLQIRGL